MRIRNLLIMAAFAVAGLQNVYSQQDELSQRKSMSGVFFLAKPTETPANLKNVAFGGAVFEGDPVKNAPFTAEAVNENITVLADGNRIIKSSTTKLYRDAEGRTRRETTASSSPKGITVAITTPFGIIADPASTSQPQIQISDPVAGVNYVLDSETRTARKFKTFPSDPNVATAIARVKQELASSGESSFIFREGNTVVSMSETTGSANSAGVEFLGTKLVEGVECTGTLIKTTIPAGQIGNERPIVITKERWYSPKLLVEVLVKRSDPRSGESTYKLVNIEMRLILCG